MNKFIGIGNLVKDPEVKYTSSNIAFCSFTIAINSSYTNEAGEREVEFVECITWKKRAENLARFQRKGNKIAIEGRWETSSYDDKDGIRRKSTKIVVHDIEYLQPIEKEESDRSSYKGPYSRQETSIPSIDVHEDDLPF